MPRKKSTFAKMSEEAKAKNKIRQQNRQIQNNISQANNHQKKIHDIRHIHINTINPVPWDSYLNAPEPFPKGTMGPKETAARQKLADYKPSDMANKVKLLDSTSRLEAKITKAIARDTALYNSWEQMYVWSKDIFEGKPAAISQAVAEYYPFKQIGNMFSLSAIQWTNTNDVSVNVLIYPSVVPNQELSVTQTGKLSIKDMTKTRYYEIYQDYACSVALKVARDFLAILPFEKINVNIMENGVDTQTGNSGTFTILSANFGRDTMDRINFNAIDASNCMRNFKNNIAFTPTKGFAPVRPLTYFPENEPSYLLNDFAPSAGIKNPFGFNANQVINNSANPNQGTKKSLHKKWWFWLIAGIFVVGIFSPDKPKDTVKDTSSSNPTIVSSAPVPSDVNVSSSEPENDEAAIAAEAIDNLNENSTQEEYDSAKQLFDALSVFDQIAISEQEEKLRDIESAISIRESLSELEQGIQSLPETEDELHTVFPDIRKLMHTIPDNALTSLSAELVEKYNHGYIAYTDYDCAVRNEELANTIVVLSATGSKYHRSSCGTLKYAGTEITLQQAYNSGYDGCGVCHPPNYFLSSPPEVEYDDNGIIWN